MNDLLAECTSKRNIAIEDFTLLSKHGVLGLYVECELTYLFIIKKEESVCYHYFAICNYEEFIESDIQFKERKLTNELIEINKYYSLGIIQMRIALNESKDIFDQLCSNSFCFKGKSVILPQDIQLLPKTHIPLYWNGENVLLQNILKPNFWGDSYIIEFFSIDNPFSKIFSSSEFDKINTKIKDLINIDLSFVYDRIGSFIFQFPITIMIEECNIINDRCKAKLSLNCYNDSIPSSDICTIIHTKQDDVITGFHVVEGIVNNYTFDIGDSNNYEYLIINKKNNLIYKHFLVNYMRQALISGNFNIQYSEPRIIRYEDNNNVEIEIFNQNLIMSGNKYAIDDRIRNRIRFNSIIKQSGDFRAFEKGQKKEALDFIREKIKSHSSSTSEICLWDPYLHCEGIFSTLYYSDIIGISMKCITSHSKNNKLKKLNGEEKIDFNKFINEQRQYFSRSNNKGINLEFRSTHENIGTDFHDRFIIFMPNDNSDFPIVYSLGTSISGFGLGHHVIQRTLDPLKIAYAFQQLWQILVLDTESLIIKLPDINKVR